MKTLFRWMAMMVLVCGQEVLAKNESFVVAVRSQAAKNYERAKAADGSPRRETYVLVNGGLFPGTARDASFDRVSYPDLAGIVAQQLARQNYFLSRTAQEADLLLVLHWGTTAPFGDASMNFQVQEAGDAMAALLSGGGTTLERLTRRFQIRSGEQRDAGGAEPALDTGAAESAMMTLLLNQRQREMLALRNARLLGYLDELNERDGISRWAGAGASFDDLWADLENARYYVVVGAYDFKAAREQRKLVLRWVTRMSIDAQGTSFDRRVAAMIASGGAFFGENSGGLKRRYRPDARVEMGELKTLEMGDTP